MYRPIFIILTVPAVDSFVVPASEVAFETPNLLVQKKTGLLLLAHLSN